MAKNGKKPTKYDNLGFFTINRGVKSHFYHFTILGREERGEARKLTERFPVRADTILRTASSM